MRETQFRAGLCGYSLDQLFSSTCPWAQAKLSFSLGGHAPQAAWGEQAEASQAPTPHLPCSQMYPAPQLCSFSHLAKRPTTGSAA